MSVVKKPEFIDLVTLRPASIDDISAIRYVHTSSFRILAGEQHTEEELEAFTDMVESQDYAADIIKGDLTVAWIDGEIVGTAGWAPADDNGNTARIRKVFVRPLFTGCGIGKMLVETAEARAQKAGFKDFSIRANMNSVPFFEKIGYEITSYGVMPTPTGTDLPVAFMRRYEANQIDAPQAKTTPLSESIRPVSQEIKPVTHENYWHHTTEH